jgi:hypothetical protein
MKALKPLAPLVLLALMSVQPARAQFQNCPNPSDEVRAALRNCQEIQACRALVNFSQGCTALQIAITRFFSSRKKDPLDVDEYQTERYPAPGPSELEQGRKNAERSALNRADRESEAKEAFNKLYVSDGSVTRRLGTDCANPLDELCRNAVYDAQKVARDAKAFNGNPDFVELRGTYQAKSAALWQRYADIQDKDYQERQRRKAARGTTDTTTPATGSVEDQKKTNAERIKANLELVDAQRREELAKAAKALEESKAAEQRLKNKHAREARDATRTQAQRDGDAEDLRQAAQGIANALIQYNRALQELKRPVPAPARSGGGTGGGGCGGRGSNTCQ